MIKSTVCYLIKDRKWLMMLRNKKANDLNQGKWIGVGGKFLIGESARQCMVREVKEETGLDVLSATFCGVIYFHYQTHESEKIWVYTSNAYTGTMAECDEGTLRYIHEDRILSLSLWEGDRIFLAKIFRQEIPFAISLYYDQNEVLIKTEMKEAETE